MTGVGELDHYELLEIPRTASRGEIDRAYRLAHQTYGEGSLALYSIFESNDAAAIRERLDEAYRVLSNAELRASYDASQQFETPLADRVVSAHAIDHETSVDERPVETPAESIDEVVGRFDGLEDDGSSEFDGVRLRRTRLFRGYEIDDISDVTKVSSTHLRNIEEENFIDLPADVYVRGFVTAYAQTIGLDPRLVVPSYMSRVQESRSGDQRGRLLGRQ